MGAFLRVEDLVVYQRLCQLHLEVCKVTKCWPRSERFELTSQIQRCSNSAAAQLAEKHNDRHVRNKIEGVNRSRGEASETVHHLYIASMKQYVDIKTYDRLREGYLECVRMLNGLEKSLERQLPEREQRWAPATPDKIYPKS